MEDEITTNIAIKCLKGYCKTSGSFLSCASLKSVNINAIGKKDLTGECLTAGLGTAIECADGYCIKAGKCV